MKKSIAFFDFDGTITTKDTLLEFIKYAKGTPSFYLGFLINSPFLIAYKLKIISNQTAKERVLRYFFNKTHLTVFQEKCNAFNRNVLPKLIRPNALTEIDQLKKAGYAIVIVSASPKNWLEGWTKNIQADLIATQLEITDGLLTGHIQGKNCHGEEKVRRIKELYNLPDYSEINAYGDSSGDKPMLALATKAFMKPFRK